MKHLFSLTLLFACLTLAFSGCDKAEVVLVTFRYFFVVFLPNGELFYVESF